MLKKLKERTIHLVILAFLTGLFLGINFSFKASANENSYKYLDYFHNVYQIIMSEYVEVPEPKKLFYGAINGMIKSLGDPYSRFLDEKSYEELQEMTTGKFVGIGVEIAVKNNDIVVITPIEDSPAMKAGVLAGDVIVKVNNTEINGKKLSQVVKLIKGLPGTKVNLTVAREGYDEPIEYEISREPIKISSVDYKLIENHPIGYIKLKNFGSDTTKDVTKAIKFFNSKNINKIIVDLRYNPGGLLNVAINISDMFLKKGEVIVSTKGRKDSGKEEIFRSENDPIFTGDIILLVNRGSASASEILSGAIRDNKRGKLLGEKTFGKGSVQKSFDIDKNIGVAITIAKYYTPSGEMIHGKGIKPDYDIPMETITENDKKELIRFEKAKLLDKFVTNNMEYSDASRTKLYDYLKSQGYAISDKTANFILKNKLYQYKKRPLYDLEFDRQLEGAINIMDKTEK